MKARQAAPLHFKDIEIDYNRNDVLKTKKAKAAIIMLQAIS